METTRTPPLDPRAAQALQHGEPAGVFVKSRLGEVHVVVDGDPRAPAVVSVHGVPGSTRDFRALAGELVGRGMCSVRLDLPGFGRSAATPGRPLLATPEQRAALIGAVMEARGHTRFAVVGHSWGGTAALATAALSSSSSSSGRVSALVMINSVGITRHRGLPVPHELMGQVKRLAALPVVGDRLVALVRQGWESRGFQSDKLLEDDDIIDRSSILGGLDFADLRLFAARVRCPALVVSSSNDALVEPLVSFTLAAALASSSSSSSSSNSTLSGKGLVSHRHLGHGGHFLQKHDAPAIASWLQARLLSAA